MPEAVVIVIEFAARFVAIRRAAAVARPGYWSPPTGRLEPGEGQAEAARREAFEELGLVVEPQERLWECHSDDGVWRLHWWRALASCAQLVPAPAEVAEARWVRREDFLALSPLFPQHREFFQHHYRPLASPATS